MGGREERASEQGWEPVGTVDGAGEKVDSYEGRRKKHSVEARMLTHPGWKRTRPLL